jgi:hypothetical protein
MILPMSAAMHVVKLVKTSVIYCNNLKTNGAVDIGEIGIDYRLWATYTPH